MGYGICSVAKYKVLMALEYLCMYEHIPVYRYIIGTSRTGRAVEHLGARRVLYGIYVV